MLKIATCKDALGCEFSISKGTKYKVLSSDVYANQITIINDHGVQHNYLSERFEIQEEEPMSKQIAICKDNRHYSFLTLGKAYEVLSYADNGNILIINNINEKHSYDKKDFIVTDQPSQGVPAMQLKPCPFCGEEAEIIEATTKSGKNTISRFRIACSKCEATTRELISTDLLTYITETAAKLWNTREMSLAKAETTTEPLKIVYAVISSEIDCRDSLDAFENSNTHFYCSDRQEAHDYVEKHVTDCEDFYYVVSLLSMYKHNAAPRHAVSFSPVSKKFYLVAITRKGLTGFDKQDTEDLYQKFLTTDLKTATEKAIEYSNENENYLCYIFQIDAIYKQEKVPPKRIDLV